jgi:putative restriction endonuclease
MATASEQIQLLVEGLEAGGLAAVGEYDPAQRPVDLTVALPDRQIAFRVFSWNITPGGTGRSPSERRVQVTRAPEVRLHVPGGPPTLLLGYDETLDVFAAWDSRMHEDPGASPSLQIPIETLREAAESGFAARERSVAAGQEVVVAFRPELASTYLALRADLEEAAAVAPEAAAAAASGEMPHEADLPGDVERRRAIRTISVAVRDARFRTRIVDAYGGRCAFCDLGLALVEAAHIRPVHAGGGDEIRNGIAACPTHHRAFDRGLLTLDDDLRLRVNEVRLDKLGAVDEDRTALQLGLRAFLRLPHPEAVRPSAEALAQHRAVWT